MYYENFDIDSVVTPLNVNEFERILKAENYNREKAKFLVDGFKYGFDLKYRGKTRGIQRFSPNLPFRIGNERILWNKVMREVQLKRFAGPFEVPPFADFIQSPIGLVPKDGGKDTRLIFHLSYPRGQDNLSVNANIPEKFTKVKYPDFQQAVELCQSAGFSAFAGKSDMKSAFRHLPMRPGQFRWLMMKARSPLDQKYYYFLDKCLSFGSSISCAVFQKFSDTISFIITKRTGKKNVNYLDDFFFVALLRALCNSQVDEFIALCREINFPISLDKTFWGDTTIAFLGLLIDTVNQVVCIPTEKIERARLLINQILCSKNRKATIQQIQRLSGFLHFLCKCVVPGRAFTTRLYALSKPEMKQHHHVKVPQDVVSDLKMWGEFLNSPQVFCRPFIDFGQWTSEDIDMYSDASGYLTHLGFGAYCQNNWMKAKWCDAGMQKSGNQKEWAPSIEYLELFGVTAGVLAWIHRFANKRICLFCDNDSVCKMINKSSSRCKNSMVLIRLLVLQEMKFNLRISAKYIKSEDNILSDSLSRMDMKRFWKHAHKSMDTASTDIPNEIWPISKIWIQ